MKDKIKHIMEEVFNTPNITETTDQTNCENWDSLHHLNLIVELENEFDVEFEPEEISEMKSFGDVYKMVASKIG